ncbi:DUF4307 domain-containing protein [Dietzia psychralcaliphila]|uniref:DUF4307 domain-containing protein n=1 Tax=Dietzia psychralcaliphila TaxID=139021 RepID=A0AAD0JU12_9ACTN|nr:DUF4307 domain-containing protein [Dietzia psychralcaliphila]AWH97374.1 hypothetical protein A6048_10725 [Dietzia psychralcaliphila]PTM85906.1 uncharacterized protein DUF4307 [Dietzia psychralcaliphila]
MSEPRSDAPSDAASQAAGAPLTGRYDDSGSGVTGKVVAGFLVLLVGALVVAGAVAGYRLSATPDISGEVIGVTVVDDSRTDVVLTVTRDDPGTAAYCIVRAQDQTKGEVGRREVYVPPSANSAIQVDMSIATSSRAFVADVYGCGDDVPDYLRR